MSSSSPIQKAFAYLTDRDAQAGRDLDDEVIAHQPRNFFTHAASLAMTKTADGLIDPKLVLSALLTSLGAPVAMAGMLVPVREAGSLLPQMLLARMTSDIEMRKKLWVAGSLVQGVCAGAIALTVLVANGWMAGAFIVMFLAILAIGRSACSFSYKDVLGKTVAKSARGTATGFAASASAVSVIVYGLLLSSGWLDREMLVRGGIAFAALLWAFAAFAMATLYEKPAPVDGGREQGFGEASMALWQDDAQLRRFVVVRGLLISTALAPPFMVTLSALGDAANAGGAFGSLGLLVLASALASFVSSYVWGRLADKSSRRVLSLAGAGGAAALLATFCLWLSGFLSSTFVLPVVLFALMVAYHGVRIGRSTHLVDMAPKEKRSAYTALANTIIGVLVLGGGLMTTAVSWIGVQWVILLLALCSGAAGFMALGLKNVQK